MNLSDIQSVTNPNPREFLAVVLAGFGNDLVPLTDNHGEEPCPKALLPIGNKPMISYILSWLDEAGITDILLICPTTHRRDILHYIDSDPTSLSSLKIDIQTFDQSRDLGSSSGTYTVLKHFASRIPSDFILLPCDFLPPPSLHLSTILNKFRVESETDGAILTSLWFEHRAPEKESSKNVGVEDAWPGPVPPPAMLYDEKTGTLLHVDTPDDADRNEEELELRMATLWKYPRTKLASNFYDAHVYVCKRSILDVLPQKPHFDSIKEDFIPWLCKVQSQRTKREKYGHVLAPITNNTSPIQSLGLQHSTRYLPTIKPCPRHRPLPSIIHTSKPIGAPLMASRTSSIATNTPASPPSSEFDNEQNDEQSLRCGVVIHRLKDGYAARANNIWSYMELNRLALKNLPPTSSSQDPTIIDPKSSISNDTLLGDSTKVGERSSVKRSVVGRHCVIGKNVKILGSVLMDHCVVEDGAKLEGCILGRNTHVGAKAELVRCITQAGYEVEDGGVYKHEKLEVTDWAAQDTEDSDESEEDESDEDS